MVGKNAFHLYCFVILCGTFIYALVGLQLRCIHLNVNFKQSSGVFKLRPNVILKQVSDPIELHDVRWFALQPELVKLYEEVAAIKTIYSCILLNILHKRFKNFNLYQKIPVKVMEVIKGWPPFIEIEQV